MITLQQAARQLIDACYRIQNDWEGTRVGDAIIEVEAALATDQELRNRADTLAKVFRPRLEGSIQMQDVDREVAAFLADTAMMKFNS